MMVPVVMNQVACGGMPEGVRLVTWKAGLLDRRHPEVVDTGIIQWSSIDRAKDEALVLPALVPLAVENLPVAVCP